MKQKRGNRGAGIFAFNGAGMNMKMILRKWVIDSFGGDRTEASRQPAAKQEYLLSLIFWN
ncbi:MAG TPA: hypothetical protein VN426_10365 [Syntrophomonadaceae bacterium]|nr:hypothetical protein [Syntrophomonadaceae bacterium]